MRSKRFVLIALTCIVALVSITGCSSSFDDTQYAVTSENNLSPDGFIYSVYENNTAVITGINTADTEMTIPDTVGNYKVVEIGADAFSGNEITKLVTIGSNVEKIGANAFSDCAALVRVDMTENVKKIGSGAFYNCENLCEVKGATGVIVIDEVAFYCCSALARFDLPDTLKTIGNEAFGACESLVEVKIPEKIESIGIGAFSYCSSLTRLDLGGLAEIGKNMTVIEYDSSLYIPDVGGVYPTREAVAVTILKESDTNILFSVEYNLLPIEGETLNVNYSAVYKNDKWVLDSVNNV